MVVLTGAWESKIHTLTQVVAITQPVSKPEEVPVAAMVEWWPAVVFGWPPVVVAFTAFAAGFLTTRTWLGFIGAAIAAPFCFAASGYPLFHWVALVALGANFVSAFLLHRGRADIAFAALVPFMMVAALLAVFAFREVRLLRG